MNSKLFSFVSFLFLLVTCIVAKKCHTPAYATNPVYTTPFQVTGNVTFTVYTPNGSLVIVSSWPAVWNSDPVNKRFNVLNVISEVYTYENGTYEVLLNNTSNELYCRFEPTATYDREVVGHSTAVKQPTDVWITNPYGCRGEKIAVDWYFGNVHDAGICNDSWGGFNYFIDCDTNLLVQFTGSQGEGFTGNRFPCPSCPETCTTVCASTGYVIEFNFVFNGTSLNYAPPASNFNLNPLCYGVETLPSYCSINCFQ